MKSRERRYRARRRALEKFGVWQRAGCPICGRQSLFYMFRYDAVCCVSCDVWVDAACQDPDCPYCSIRPSTPSEALYLEERYFEERKGSDRKDRLRRKYQHKQNGKSRHAKRKIYFADLNFRKNL